MCVCVRACVSRYTHIKLKDFNQIESVRDSGSICFGRSHFRGFPLHPIGQAAGKIYGRDKNENRNLRTKFKCVASTHIIIKYELQLFGREN